MFRELRATAPQTYYTFRASNGTADVLYVLLESLTALGLQALFFEERKCERPPKHGAQFAVDKLTQIVRAKKKKRKRPQTCDTNQPRRPFRRRRATKVFWDFSRWILMSDKKVKIILVLLMFLRIVQKVTFWASGMEDMFRHRSPRTLNYIY